MFSMREAFTVGIVLTAKDMYSGVMSKAQRDIDILAKTSQAQADKFTRSLATYQKIGGIGVAMTMAGAEVSRFWEDAVATAGRNQANIDRVMIQMGDSSDSMRQRVTQSFHDIKTVWGFTDDAISESLKELSGRLGSNNSALQAINSVSAFARARNIDLANATKMLTTIYNQYGDTMGDNLSIQDKYSISANKLDYILKGLGGDWESFDFFLGSAGLKAKAMGQGLDILGAAVRVIGGEGGRLRMGGASMVQMLDDMVKIRKMANWQEFFPTYKKSGSLLDMIADLRKAYSDKGWMAPGIENQQKILDSLTKNFGTNAPMMLLFIQRFDLLKPAEEKLKALGKETGNTSTVMKEANATMETWDGTVQRFNALMEEFKEMLGSGGIPMIKLFHKEIGNLTEYLSTHEAEKKILGITTTTVGLGAEVAKLTGPILSLIALYGIWRTQSALTAAVQASLNAQTAAGMTGIGGFSAALGVNAMSKPASLWRFLFGATTASGAISSLITTGGILAAILITVKGIAEIYDKSRRPSILPLATPEDLKYIQDIQGNLDKPLTGFKTVEDFRTRVQELTSLMNELQKKSDVYDKLYPEAGAHPYQGLLEHAQTKRAETIKGYRLQLIRPTTAPQESTLFSLKFKTGFSLVPIKPDSIPGFQSGGYVPHDTLGFLHSGEYVFPKNRVQSLTPKFQSPITFNGGININMTSSGSSMLDAHNLARLVLNEINKSLKFDSKRFA